MNIFEHLGKSKDHRPENKVTMLVKNYDEVPESKKIWPMVAQVKKDGVYALFVVKDERIRIFSRTGKEYTNVNHLCVWDDRLIDGVYIAELCCSSCSLEVLSGMVNPNRVEPLNADQESHKIFMTLFYHDFFYIEAFLKGFEATEYEYRVEYLREILPLDARIISYKLVGNIEAAKALAAKLIAEGEEGLVLKQILAGWKAGHKGFRMMKIVRGVDLDLLCVGVEEGVGKYANKVANLIFKWKGKKTIKAMLGKGWTHQDAEDMWRAQTGDMFSDDNHNKPVGRVFHVHALQISSKGVLRLPKVCEKRVDKTEPDII